MRFWNWGAGIGQGAACWAGTGPGGRGMFVPAYSRPSSGGSLPILLPVLNGMAFLRAPWSNAHQEGSRMI